MFVSEKRKEIQNVHALHKEFQGELSEEKHFTNSVLKSLVSLWTISNQDFVMAAGLLLWIFSRVTLSELVFRLSSSSSSGSFSYFSLLSYLVAIPPNNFYSNFCFLQHTVDLMLRRLCCYSAVMLEAQQKSSILYSLFFSSYSFQFVTKLICS